MTQPAIVTDRDLRGRVLAAGLGPDIPVTQVMSYPLITIDAGAPAFAALRLMLDDNIHHLPVVEEGKIIGVVSATDLLLHQGHNPLYLRGIIEHWDNSHALHYAEEIRALVRTLFNSGLAAIHISKIVSSLNDALVKRLVALTIEKLGPAPTPFAWIVFGSEGRLEQTLLTDQDNALIYQDDSDTARAYFADLAKQVVNALISAGFPPCAGGFMATHWCKPLAAWRERFSEWIRLPVPQALLDAAIFFDFRAVAGTLALDTLEEIVGTAKSERRFLSHLARGALDFYPPLGFFNRLRSDNGKVDLKKSSIAPIVGLARVAALAAGSRERSTLARLDVAKASGLVLSAARRHRAGGNISISISAPPARATRGVGRQDRRRSQHTLEGFIGFGTAPSQRSVHHHQANSERNSRRLAARPARLVPPGEPCHERHMIRRLFRRRQDRLVVDPAQHQRLGINPAE